MSGFSRGEILPGSLVPFELDQVRTAYRPAAPEARMSGNTLAGMVWALRSTAHLPGVIVKVDPEFLAPDAMVADGGGCSPIPGVTVSPGLIDGNPANALVLYGTLAHEMAHVRMGHLTDRAHQRWTRLMRALLAGAVIGTALAGPSWAALAAVAAAGLVFLVRAHGARLAEYEADHQATVLLKAAGVPGTAMTDMLTGLASHETRWTRRIGWLLDEHPPTASRIAAVRRGIPPRRLDWSAAWCCTSTGQRLATRAHRRAHRHLHGRCAPHSWRLWPLRRPRAAR